MSKPATRLTRRRFIARSAALAGGRIECLNASADRNVHVLTRHLGEHTGTLAMSVRVGRVDGGPLSGGKGTVGFRIGVQSPLRDYRHSLIYGRGLDAGITDDGATFIGDVRSARPGSMPLRTETAELRPRLIGRRATLR